MLEFDRFNFTEKCPGIIYFLRGIFFIGQILYVFLSFFLGKTNWFLDNWLAKKCSPLEIRVIKQKKKKCFCLILWHPKNEKKSIHIEVIYT